MLASKGTVNNCLAFQRELGVLWGGDLGPSCPQAQVWVTATPRANPLTSARPGKMPTLPPSSGPPARSCCVTLSGTRAASLQEGVREDLTA